jgi:hypothetical protein
MPHSQACASQTARLLRMIKDQNNAMSNEAIPTHLLYQGPRGRIVCQKASFFASKNGFPIGTYDTFEEAMAALAGKGSDKATEGGQRTKRIEHVKLWERSPA